MIKVPKTFIQHYNNMEYLYLLEQAKVRDGEIKRGQTGRILQVNNQIIKERKQLFKKENKTIRKFG